MKTKTLLPLLSAFIIYHSSFIISYAQSPSYLWAKSAGGTSYDQGYSCTTDVSGNIIVTGNFGSPTITFGTTVLTNANAGYYDMFIVKYDTSGNVLWAKSGGGTSPDLGNSCTTDPSGNIIATGSFRSPTITFGATVLTNADSGYADMFIVKYDSSGNVLWAKSAGRASDDYGWSCSTDPSGNIIATGSFSSDTIIFGTTVLTNASSGSDDMFIVKYDTSGNVLWAKSAGGTGYDSDVNCSTDASGNIIATGYFSSDTITFGTIVLTNAGSGDMFIVKYDSSGNVLWAKSEGGSSYDQVRTCSTDASGNIIATGSFDSDTITFGATVLTNAGNNDIFIVKYDTSGNVLWAKSGGGTSSDLGNSCTTDPSGNIIATGSFRSPTITFGTTVLTNAGSGTDDMFIVKYNSSGNVLWATSAGGTDYDYGLSCSTDVSGNIIATGSFGSPTISFGATFLTNAGSYDMFIVKLDTATTTGINFVTHVSNPVLLFPNPAANHFTITLGNTHKKAVVTISGITGQLIYTTTARETQKIEVNTKDFAEGIYVVRIQTADLIETKKLIVVK